MANKGGKWATIKNKLARFEQDEGWQKDIDLAKQAKGWAYDESARKINKTLNEMTHVELAKVFAHFRKRKDACEEQLARINTVLEAINQCMVEVLEDQDFNSFKVESLGNANFFIQYDVYASTEDREKMEAYFLENDMTEMFSVNYQRLSAYCKAQLEAQIEAGIAVRKNPKAEELDAAKECGAELPSGVKLFIKPSLRVQGLNKKEKADGNETDN